MRIALISDVHANAEALRVVEDVLRSADRVICLGDCVGYYTQVNEALDLVRSFDPIAVLGNHDAYLLDACPSDVPEAVRFGIEEARRQITADHRAWLASLPLTWQGQLSEAVPGGRWRITSTPTESIRGRSISSTWTCARSGRRTGHYSSATGARSC